MIVEPRTTRIGWIGLGVMGRSMCAHLVDAGFSATVYTRTRGTADSVLAKGAVWADGPKAVAGRLAAIAKRHGAALDPGRGAALDLAQTDDPLTACRGWLGKGQA